MRQSTQFRPQRQQTRIRTLDADFLADANLVASDLEDLFGFVMRGEAGGETEPLTEGEAG